MRRQRVLVLGGGFGGVYAASYLAASESAKDDLDVVLVSDRNHFTFTPLLAEVVGGALGAETVTLPLRVLGARRGFAFCRGRVEDVDTEACVVETTGGRLSYDYAVIATGAGAAFFGNEQVARHALPFVTVRDAVRIRDRVLEQAERAVQSEDEERRRRLMTFVVAGGGPAGVEAASEIWDLAHRVLPAYYDFDASPRIVLAQGDTRILRGWNQDLAEEGLETLRERGIDVRLRTKVTDFDGRRARVEGPDGAEEEIETELLVWTAGTTPTAAGYASGVASLTGALGEQGHLQIDDRLRVEGLENVFAVGDTARLVDPRTERPYPAVAPIAISQGVRAAGNVENLIAGREMEAYRAHHAGKIVSLGAGVALAEVLGFRVTGMPAWLLYRTSYLLKMVGGKNKVRAGLSLLLNRVFERDLAVPGATEAP